MLKQFFRVFVFNPLTYLEFFFFCRFASNSKSAVLYSHFVDSESNGGVTFFLKSQVLSPFSITPASNLGYLAPTGQFFIGAKLFIGTDPLDWK